MNISGLTPCGKTINYTSADGHYRDESGCRLAFVHYDELERLINIKINIEGLHRPNHEDIISRCELDGEPYPCQTMRAGF